MFHRSDARSRLFFFLSLWTKFSARIETFAKVQKIFSFSFLFQFQARLDHLTIFFLLFVASKMNFEKFRRTGELSDITVIVDKTEFKLHTFPLFTKSDFFKEKLAESKETTPLVVRLDNEFPGGAQIFNQLADFFYSIPITIDHKNVVPLRSAAAFIKCEELASLIDKRFDELLRVAKIRYDISVPLVFLEQSTGEYQHWAKQTGIVDKCIQTMIDALIRGTGSHLNKSDREVIVRLPLEWILQLIDSCPPESKFATLPIVKHYVSVLVFDQPTSNSSNLNGNSENDHPSAFTPVTRKDDLPVMTIDEKRAILEQIVKSLQNTISQMPLTWLQTAYDKAVEFDCECKSTLSSFVTQTLLHSTDLDDAAENIPDHVMTSLLERFSKHQEEQAKDLHLITKVIRKRERKRFSSTSIFRQSLRNLKTQVFFISFEL